MKKMKKGQVNIFTAVIVSVIVLVVGSFAVSAAYINLNTVKRVVSTQGSSGTPFSSNYLLAVPKGTTSFSVKNIYFPEGAAQADFEINVCNYVQNDPSRVNENDISYSLKLTLRDNDGTLHTGSLSGLSVSDGSGGTYSFSNSECTVSGQFLEGKKKSVNTYTVTYPRELLNSVELTVQAEPSDSSSYSAANGNMLGRTFVFSEYNTAATAWTGSFSETVTENYDAFNYIIRGQGKGTVKLKWDPAQLEINSFFLDNYGLTGNMSTDGGKNVLSFDVDSGSGENRFDIQFYKTENGVYTDMDTVNGYVTVEFTETV